LGPSIDLKESMAFRSHSGVFASTDTLAVPEEDSGPSTTTPPGIIELSGDEVMESVAVAPLGPFEDVEPAALDDRGFTVEEVKEDPGGAFG
jgi:hypothetical protein